MINTLEYTSSAVRRGLSSGEGGPKVIDPEESSSNPRF